MAIIERQRTQQAALVGGQLPRMVVTSGDFQVSPVEGAGSKGRRVRSPLTSAFRHGNLPKASNLEPDMANIGGVPPIKPPDAPPMPIGADDEEDDSKDTKNTQPSRPQRREPRYTSPEQRKQLTMIRGILDKIRRENSAEEETYDDDGYTEVYQALNEGSDSILNEFEELGRIVRETWVDHIQEPLNELASPRKFQSEDQVMYQRRLAEVNRLRALRNRRRNAISLITDFKADRNMVTHFASVKMYDPNDADGTLSRAAIGYGIAMNAHSLFERERDLLLRNFPDRADAINQYFDYNIFDYVGHVSIGLDGFSLHQLAVPVEKRAFSDSDVIRFYTGLLGTAHEKDAISDEENRLTMELMENGLAGEVSQVQIRALRAMREQVLTRFSPGRNELQQFPQMIDHSIDDLVSMALSLAVIDPNRRRIERVHRFRSVQVAPEVEQNIDNAFKNLVEFRKRIEASLDGEPEPEVEHVLIEALNRGGLDADRLLILLHLHKPEKARATYRKAVDLAERGVNFELNSAFARAIADHYHFIGMPLMADIEELQDNGGPAIDSDRQHAMESIRRQTTDIRNKRREITLSSTNPAQIEGVNWAGLVMPASISMSSDNAHPHLLTCTLSYKDVLGEGASETSTQVNVELFVDTKSGTIDWSVLEPLGAVQAGAFLQTITGVLTTVQKQVDAEYARKKAQQQLPKYRPQVGAPQHRDQSPAEHVRDEVYSLKKEALAEARQRQRSPVVGVRDVELRDEIAKHGSEIRPEVIVAEDELRAMLDRAHVPNEMWGEMITEIQGFNAAPSLEVARSAYHFTTFPRGAFEGKVFKFRAGKLGRVVLVQDQEASEKGVWRFRIHSIGLKKSGYKDLGSN